MQVTPKLVTDVESGAHLSAEGNIEVSKCIESTIESMFRFNKFKCTTLSIRLWGVRLLMHLDIPLDVC